MPMRWRLSVFKTLKFLIYRLLPIRLAGRWRRGLSAQGPLTVLGMHAGVLGLGEAARLSAAGLEDSGRQVFRRDVCRFLGVAAELAVPGPAPVAGGVLISQINPPELMWVLFLTGGADLIGRRHVGYWVWEMPEAPKFWRSAFAYVEEVWTPSEFTAAALRAIAPPRFPIRVLPHPVHLLPRREPDRAAFGLAGEAPVVLVVFDLRSTVGRKNPWAALAAYQAAVPEADGSAILLLKISACDADPAAMERLRALAAARPDIRLLDAHLDDEAMRSLMASVDIVLSLHRSEGFGLVPAEAMWLGKPVVATGWSGNMDFMDEASVGLVRYRMVEAPADSGFYAGGRWAEADIAHAAELLARLIRDPGHRKRMGERARAKAEAVFSPGRWRAIVDSSLTRDGDVATPGAGVGVTGRRLGGS